jgi:hypothetical protein
MSTFDTPGSSPGPVDRSRCAGCGDEGSTDLPASLAARARDARRGLPIPPVNLHPDLATGENAVDINTTISTDLAAHRRCSLCGMQMGYWVKRAELHLMQHVIGRCSSPCGARGSGLRRSDDGPRMGERRGRGVGVTGCNHVALRATWKQLSSICPVRLTGCYRPGSRYWIRPRWCSRQC